MSALASAAGDDLAAFFDTAGFAESVSYQGGGSGSVTIPAIFYAPFEAAQMFGSDVPNSQPAAHVKSSDVSAPLRNDVFTRADGSVYYVIASHPDGTGVTLLILSSDQSHA